jgi:hypothetical protein
VGDWATTGDVETYTGVAVTDAALAMAEADVVVYANRSPEASAGMSTRDLYWMKMACCYQAAWRSSQVGVAGRQSVASMSQDGMSVTYGKEWQAVLGPMAARSLKNLSWMGSRTLRTPNVRYPRGLGEWEASGGVVNGDFLDESTDEATHWQSM